MRSVSNWICGGVIIFCILLAFILQKMDNLNAIFFIALALAYLLSGWRD